MSQNPLVSIVCATYNHAPFLRETLDSFLAQRTTFSIEILVHDDASTDGTADIVLEYQKRYPDLFRCILQTENQFSKGAKTWVTLLKIARGKYAAICEGDDYWRDPLKLQKQFDYLESHPNVALSCHNAIIINQKGEQIGDSRLKPSEQRDLSQDELIKGGYVLSLTMFFRNALKEFPPELFRSPNGDLFICTLIGEHGGAHYHDDIIPAAYRFHEGGVWSLQQQVDRHRKAVRSYEQLALYFQRTNKPVYQRHFANLNLEMQFVVFAKLWQSGERKNASRMIPAILRLSRKHFGYVHWLKTFRKLAGLTLFLLRAK